LKGQAGFWFYPEVAVANFPAEKPMELPRLDTNDFPPKSENYKTVKDLELVSVTSGK
jgi:hypothetical protein